MDISYSDSVGIWSDSVDWVILKNSLSGEDKKENRFCFWKL